MQENKINATIAISTVIAALLMCAALSFAIGKWSWGKHGYTITFTICAVVVAVGILASLAVPGRRGQPAHVLTVADAVPAGD